MFPSLKNSTLDKIQHLSKILSKAYITFTEQQIQKLASLYPYSGVEIYGKYDQTILSILKYLLLWHRYPYVEQLIKSDYKNIVINVVRKPNKIDVMRRCFKFALLIIHTIYEEIYTKESGAYDL